LVALTSLISATLFTVPNYFAGATPVAMSSLQVAKFALRCAGKGKITTYFDIKCAAVHSTTVSLVTGVIGGPTEYPMYSAIGFLLDRATNTYSCYAYPDKADAQPINVTNNCPLWLISKEYAKTNFPAVYALAGSFDDAPPPTLTQVQTAAANAPGTPSITSGSGKVYTSSSAPAATFRMAYGSGIGRNWCLWYFPATGAMGDAESWSLFGPPGMYGTC
jgi:hypothetical protein